MRSVAQRASCSQCGNGGVRSEQHNQGIARVANRPRGSRAAAPAGFVLTALQPVRGAQQVLRCRDEDPFTRVGARAGRAAHLIGVVRHRGLHAAVAALAVPGRLIIISISACEDGRAAARDAARHQEEPEEGRSTRQTTICGGHRALSASH